jgi:hypothetical protein
MCFDLVDAHLCTVCPSKVEVGRYTYICHQARLKGGAVCNPKEYARENKMKLTMESCPYREDEAHVKAKKGKDKAVDKSKEA